MMPSFEYTARRRDGKKIGGLLAAHDRLAAIRQVERMGHTPLTIEAQSQLGRCSYEVREETVGAARRKRASLVAASFVIFLALAVLLFLPIKRHSPSMPRATGVHKIAKICNRPKEITNSLPACVPKNEDAVHISSKPEKPDQMRAPFPWETAEQYNAMLYANGPQHIRPVFGINEGIVQWSVGSVDSDFGISIDGFREKIDKAVMAWERAVGQKLFEYTPAAGVRINCVSDFRNQNFAGFKKIYSEAQQLRKCVDELNESYTNLKVVHTEAQAEYEKTLLVFENRWAKYGGVFDDEHMLKQYENERASIIDQNAKVIELVQELNDTAKAINRANSEIHEEEIKADEMLKMNSGCPSGEYSGRRIDIYWFNSGPDLIRTLAHELGHALGLGHDVIHPEAIMSPTYKVSTEAIMSPMSPMAELVVSQDDVKALKCVPGFKIVK